MRSSPTQDAIVVEGVGKEFRGYRGSRRWSELLVRGWRAQPPPQPFWALRGVSFRLERGRTLGVIGRNGAGKSTLLRLVGGISHPSEGRLAKHGRVRALLDLGAHFHPDLTGRENVFVAGVVAGLTRREVRERLASIVRFAEIEPFIDHPVRTLSSGMLMRLAFAVAVHTDPEILLVDEVLAVGDLGFQSKCLERIAEFKRHGCAILIVSHDTDAMKRLCDEVLWLKEGRTEAHGDPKEVVERYVNELTAETRRRTAADRASSRASSGRDLRVNENRFGSLELEITAVRIRGARGEIVEEIEPGEAVTVEIDYHASQPIASPHFGVSISREDGFVCYDVTTGGDGHALPEVAGPGSIVLEMDRCDLAAGAYYVDVAAYERAWAYAYDSHWHVYPLDVRGSVGKGAISAPHRWRLEREARAARSPDRPTIDKD
jgi:homopolymeric O-antigen transport system ATP-binding protein